MKDTLTRKSSAKAEEAVNTIIKMQIILVEKEIVVKASPDTSTKSDGLLGNVKLDKSVTTVVGQHFNTDNILPRFYMSPGERDNQVF